MHGGADVSRFRDWYRTDYSVTLAARPAFRSLSPIPRAAEAMRWRNKKKKSAGAWQRKFPGDWSWEISRLGRD